jgi:hypothetical protein
MSLHSTGYLRARGEVFNSFKLSTFLPKSIVSAILSILLLVIPKLSLSCVKKQSYDRRFYLRVFLLNDGKKDFSSSRKRTRL